MGPADINLALEVSKLAPKFEDQNISRVDQIDRELQEKIAALEMINALKAAIMSASKSENGQNEINFNEDKLKDALDQFLAAFPDGAAFVPKDGILHNDKIAEGLRYLEGKAREPMTWTEFLLHKLSRYMADVQIAIDALRTILEDANRSAHFIIRNKGQ